MNPIRTSDSPVAVGPLQLPTGSSPPTESLTLLLLLIVQYTDASYNMSTVPCLRRKTHALSSSESEGTDALTSASASITAQGDPPPVNRSRFHSPIPIEQTVGRVGYLSSKFYEIVMQ